MNLGEKFGDIIGSLGCWQYSIISNSFVHVDNNILSWKVTILAMKKL